MTQIVIDKKKYVLLPEKEYEVLQLKAALKNKPAKKLSLEAGKRRAYKLIDKWAALAKKNKGEWAYAFWKNKREDIYQDYLK